MLQMLLFALDESDKTGVEALGSATEVFLQKQFPNAVFVTISPSATLKHNCIGKTKSGKIRKLKIPYGMLKQQLQFRYCLKILTREHLCWFNEGAQVFCTWELNKLGNVHFHVLISDPSTIKNETNLDMYRRDVLNCPETQRNLPLNKRDYMNSIVNVTKPLKEVIQYMIKDMYKNLPVFDYYCHFRSKELVNLVQDRKFPIVYDPEALPDTASSSTDESD